METVYKVPLTIADILFDLRTPLEPAALGIEARLGQFVGENAGPVSRTIIHWRETDGPPVKAPARQGYGLELIRELAEYELHGKVEVNFAAEGFACRIELPLKSVLAKK